MRQHVPQLEPADFTRLALAGELGAVAGMPVVIVDGGIGEPDDEVGWGPGAVPVLVIGRRSRGWTGRPADDDPHDIVLAADDARLDAVLEQVERHPMTAAALAVLLRSHPTDDVEAGLADESSTYSTLQAGSEFASWLAGRRSRPPADDAEDVVLIARADDTLQVTLNRPDSHNAVNEALRTGLADALGLALMDPSIARVVVRGNGPSYCSGGDLREFGSFADPASAHLSRLTRSPGRLAHLLGDRLHVELHGACLGAGIEVPAFAGSVIAAPGTRIGLPEIGIGLIPGAGGTVSLPRRIGRHRTALLALLGDTIDEHEAHEWGLIDGVAAASS